MIIDNSTLLPIWLRTEEFSPSTMARPDPVRLTFDIIVLTIAMNELPPPAASLCTLNA